MLTSYKLFVGQVRPRAPPRRAAAAAQRANPAAAAPRRAAPPPPLVPRAPPPPRAHLAHPPAQVPLTFTAEQLRSTFEPFGEIQDITIVHDKQSGASKGCGFVTFSSESSARAAIDELNEKAVLGPGAKPLVVKFADGLQQRMESKLYVGALPPTMPESDVLALFASYGEVRSISIQCAPRRRPSLAPPRRRAPPPPSGRARAPPWSAARRRRPSSPTPPPRGRAAAGRAVPSLAPALPPPPPPPPLPPRSPSPLLLARSPDEGKSYAFVEYATRAELATAAIGAPRRAGARPAHLATPHLHHPASTARISHRAPLRPASPARRAQRLRRRRGVRGAARRQDVDRLQKRRRRDDRAVALRRLRRLAAHPPAGVPAVVAPRRRHRGVRVAAGVRVGAGGGVLAGDDGDGGGDAGDDGAARLHADGRGGDGRGAAAASRAARASSCSLG